MTDYALIGKRIRANREKLQMSQYELAEQAGLSNTYISRIERAKKQISLEALMRVSEVLGVSISELVYMKGGAVPAAKDNMITTLISDCTDNEKQIIYAQIELLKQGIRSL